LLARFCEQDSEHHRGGAGVVERRVCGDGVEPQVRDQALQSGHLTLGYLHH
jgi:hypothetical protein